MPGLSDRKPLLEMRAPFAINLMPLFLPELVCATSLRHQSYPAADYLPIKSSLNEDVIRNQQVITTIRRNENSILDMTLKSDGTPTSSDQTHQQLTTSLLNGYYVTAVYIDDKCSTVMSAVAYELNTCIDYGKFFLKCTATAEAESETKYSDRLCTAKESLADYIDYTGTCTTMPQRQSTLSLINSNGALPSSLTMASIR